MNNINQYKHNFSNPFISLKHKNFRYYWFSMCISLIGTWMQNIAQPWLAYTLTNSPILLSLIGALQFTPTLLFSLFAGVIVERISRKKIILFTQSASLLITFVLAILVLEGNVKYWHILITATALGIVNTLDLPARQSFIVELVGKEDLMNAIALNSSVFNVARIIGPAIAGLLMGYFGIAYCFLANSLSFAAVVLCMIFIKSKTTQNRPLQKTLFFEDIKNGLVYIFNNKTILNIIIMMAILGTFAMNFNISVPIFAKEILFQQETGFGFLMSFMGIGSFLGAMLIATMSKSSLTKFILNVIPILIGIFLILDGLANSFWTFGLCLAISGFLFVTFSSTANSALQLICSDEYRGRVMSAYSLVFAGSTPIGNLYTGLFIDWAGARIGFYACGGIIIILLILLFIKKPQG